MSECAGAHTVSKLVDLQLEGVGKTIPGAETKLDNPNEDGHGEVSDVLQTINLITFL